MYAIKKIKVLHRCTRIIVLLLVIVPFAFPLLCYHTVALLTIYFCVSEIQKYDRDGFNYKNGVNQFVSIQQNSIT